MLPSYNYGTCIRWLLRNKCAFKEISLSFDLYKAFGKIETVTKQIFFSEKTYFIYSCSTCSELPSICHDIADHSPVRLLSRYNSFYLDISIIASTLSAKTHQHFFLPAVLRIRIPTVVKAGSRYLLWQKLDSDLHFFYLSRNPVSIRNIIESGSLLRIELNPKRALSWDNEWANCTDNARKIIVKDYQW